MNETVDAELVERRVADWKNRLQNLRETVQEWSRARPGFSVQEHGLIQMNEHLMQEFGIAPTTVSVFDVMENGNRRARFIPKALWVVGANGRVDIVTGTEAPILVDESEPLASEPHWRLYRNKRNGTGVEFTQEELLNLLS